MTKLQKAYNELIDSIEKRYIQEGHDLSLAEKSILKQCLIHSQKLKGKSLEDSVGHFQKKSAEYMWLRQYKIFTPNLDGCKPDSRYYDFVRKTRESFIWP